MIFSIEKAYADGGTVTPVGNADGRAGISIDGAIKALSNNAVTYLLIIGGGLAVIFLILYGIQYIMAGADDKKVTAARKGIINAVIGIIIIVATFVIIQVAVAVGKSAGTFVN